MKNTKPYEINQNLYLDLTKNKHSKIINSNY